MAADADRDPKPTREAVVVIAPVQERDDAWRYGFRWGPMVVERIAHIEGRGYALNIKTAHQSMQVYISEAGRVIRAEEPRDASRPQTGQGASDDS